MKSGIRDASRANFNSTEFEKSLAPELPEDLYHLIKKAVAVRKHLERNRKDKDSKFRLILIESRIHRLSRYYKSVGVLPPTWRYESATASTLVA
ncbi:ribosomal protein S15 [Aspergillus leporis]|uniref:Ribosomal protein S15 n=1 Tax=Aspergillus leporis TaxID=41062 RepID=A0A5N5WV97_9EURO|nr:ribosomal protein S15 [Aspergillus leporis]